ncbi:MAG: SDR family oxidoreductase [Opitutales bacterium]|nr:SDR family oxidoreductase [Opitutales bacterium]
MTGTEAFSLAGRKILITGASSGIGAACAADFSDARLFLTGRNAERLAAFAGTRIVADLCDAAGREALVAGIDEPLDGIVFAAGTNARRPFAAISEKKLRSIFETNFFAASLLCKSLLSARKISAGASLVFIASIDGPVTVHPANGMYASSKAALSALARTLALELSPSGIRVNLVCPGAVETPLLHTDLSDEQLAADAARYPLGRFGVPADIAHAVRYLLSPAASWVTGTQFVIDGGITLI